MILLTGFTDSTLSESIFEILSEQPLDALINNAAQTVRRSPSAYSALVREESHPLQGIEKEVPITALGTTTEAHPHALMRGATPTTHSQSLIVNALHVAGPTLGIDAGGLIPDVTDHNSWVATVGSVDPLEMLEVQLCNATAPFILFNRLRPALEASPARRKYVVNVSAMEGVFSRRYKGPWTSTPIWPKLR